MRRLGYKHFVAQGGDWGAVVTDMLACRRRRNCSAFTPTCPAQFLPRSTRHLSPARRRRPVYPLRREAAYEQLVFFYKHVYYAFWMGTRPQTLTGFADSPIGLATFLLDHDARSLELIARSFDGQTEGLTPRRCPRQRHAVLADQYRGLVGRLYWENKLAFFSPKGVKVPVAVSVFPDELYQTPRNWAERAYPKLIHYNKLAKGGHFAAWEQPELFTEELRAGFRSLRK